MTPKQKRIEAHRKASIKGYAAQLVRHHGIKEAINIATKNGHCGVVAFIKEHHVETK